MGCTFINEPLQRVILLLNDEKIAPAKIQNLDFFLIFQKYFKEKKIGKSRIFWGRNRFWGRNCARLVGREPKSWCKTGYRLRAPLHKIVFFRKIITFFSEISVKRCRVLQTCASIELAHGACQRVQEHLITPSELGDRASQSCGHGQFQKYPKSTECFHCICL